ncbi:hypothetical protein ARMA_0239 [Ardenticatena maritima]|uniref:Uncharacterized protein n=1 Tax=Ardenticatena maritima TaxID=872965 RepID=A0A0M8K548_9CHLR|nr:hypothetical protein ARMA_0239 [Ardenticatena maritima]
MPAHTTPLPFHKISLIVIERHNMHLENAKAPNVSVRRFVACWIVGETV